MKTIVLCLIGAAIIFLVGKAVVKRFFKKPEAILDVDTSDPETDHYKLIFLIPLDDVSRRKRINVKIRTDIRK